MATCPNKSLESWKLLATSRGEDVAYYLWDKYDGNVPASQSKESIVKSGLKATYILQSDRANGIFNTIAKNKITGEAFWKKLQVDLAIPKDQVDLMKSLNTENREELVAGLLGNYSYAVEINTAMALPKGDYDYQNGFIYNGVSYVNDSYTGEYWYTENGENTYITKDEFNKASAEASKNTPSSFYGNMTVPGGTNYTENEIATPAIAPAIVGHAQFSTNNGIGWFRSDDKLGNIKERKFDPTEEFEGNITEDNSITGTPTKTRRILEVQSDLFQKGRDKENLAIPIPSKTVTTAGMFQNEEYTFTLNNDKYESRVEMVYSEAENQSEPTERYYKNDQRISSKEIEIAKEEYVKSSGSLVTKNQFLKLLNKDNNWVTFFLKSILQDSAKKGYEKVLFPSGNTASKVEGHTTLEEFKKQKQDRIKQLEDSNNTETFYNEYGDVYDEPDFLKKERIENNNREIAQLKRELENIEGPQGFGALKPIYNFYENTVKNILNKQYGRENVKEFTDEFGNTWNEVTITPEREQAPVMLQKKGTESSKASAKTVAMVKDFLARIGVDFEEVDNIVMGGVKIDANGAAILTQKLVQVVRGMEASSLTEEAMHFAVEILEQKDPALFNKLLSEIGKYNIYNDVFNLYSQDKNYQTPDGKPNIRKIKKEAIGKLLAEMVIEKNEGLTEKPELLAKSESWWEQILNALKSLFLKSGFDEAAMKILSGEAIGTADDVRAEEQDIYLQKNDDPQSAAFDKLIAVQNTITKTDEGYFIDGKKVPTRVSDLVGQWYERRFKANDITKDEFSTAVDDTKAEKGTAGHKDLEFAFSLFVDEDGYLRDKALGDDDYVSQLNPTNRDMYELLRDNLKERLNSFPTKTRFMSEVMVYDPKRGLAGTIDFLAIDKEGTTSILDWKFTDINIEKEGDQTDVPWYKISAWNQQMDQYKLILKNAYGIKDGKFGQTRMIPIKAHYSFTDYKNQILPELTDIEIGDVDVQNIKQDYLIPVGLQEETTGNDEIDALLVKLNAEYKKISESKVLPSEKLNKAEQLNALFKAIRQLQMKQNIRPLVNQARILNKQIQSTIDKYDSKFKGVDYKSFDDDQREGIFNDYADELETAKATLDIYTSLDTELEFLLVDATTEEDKQLREDLRQAASKARALRANLTTTSNKFVDYVAKAEGTTGVLNAEKIIKGFSKFFSSTSTIQMRTMEVLYKKANRALGFAGFDTLDETKKLEQIKSKFDVWAKAKGLNSKNYFNILKKADKNELINEFDTEFYKKLKEVTGKKGVGYAWVKDNVDIQAYKESLKDKIAEEYQRIEDKNRLGTEEEIDREIKREKAQVDKLYSTSTTEGAGWYQYDLLKKFPIRDKWETAEWKELTAKGNEPAKAFYDYIIERNDYYKSIGYINSKEARVFLPFVRKTILEKIHFGGDITIGEQFFRAISVDEGDVGFGQVDPLTGQPIDTIPTYFTKDIGSDVSTDLFRTIALYNEMALRYKYLSEIEGQARLLLSTERNKKAIGTSLFGKTLYDNGKLQYTPNNTDNSQLLQSMIKGIIYGQKYLENDTFDMLLGKLGNFGERANAKMGMKIFPEGLSQRQISVNKVLDTLNDQFQLNAMGLNVLSAGSNLFGGTAQSIINSGKYFTKADYAATSLWLLSNKMKGLFGVKGADKVKAIAALEYFLPLTDNYNKEIAKKLSLNTLTQENIQEFLMILMRNSDLAVQTTNFYSFLKNSIVIDGQVINAREYLRKSDKYAKMYQGTNAEQRKQLDADFEREVKDLVDE